MIEMARTGGKKYVRQVLFQGVSKYVAADKLREKRLAKGRNWTQEELADRTGMPHKQYVTYYEGAKTDWRLSNYVSALVRELDFTTDELRELGMDILMDSSTPKDTVPGSSDVTLGSVKLPFLGFVQAVDNKFKKSKGQLSKEVMEVSRDFIGRNKLEDLFVLQVNGESMVSDEVRQQIPSSSFVLCKTQNTAGRGNIVIAWIKNFPDTEDGLGVLKVYNPKQDDVMLDSYNRQGLRFMASDYDMVIQGIVLYAWQKFN